jgi:hypothetical protein
MNQDPDPRTPPAPTNATGVRQGFITGRVLIVLLVSIALAVAAFVAASVLS